MAYTINHLYKKVLEGADKMGSDFFPLPYVMNKLESATYDFIGETIKYIENTQEIRDDLRTLYKPYKLTVVADESDTTFKAVVLPSDYLHLMNAKVIDSKVPVRDTRVIRHGQTEIFESNPNTRASAEYPTVVIYKNYLKIISPGTPTHVQGFYVKKPIFGAYMEQDDDIEVNIAVDLPDNVTEKIIKSIVNEIFIATGDPRAQLQLQDKMLYRKRGN